MTRRHPRQATLLAGDERALRHAETCDRCADLLLGEEGQAGLGAMLKAVLDPREGFHHRATSAAMERIRLQDLWELFGDTAGGVGDALRFLGGRVDPSPTQEDD